MNDYFSPEWDMVSIIEFCENTNRTMGGIISTTATADPAPTLAIPPAATVLRTEEAFSGFHHKYN